MENKHSAIIQFWLESESGWGTRPDGYSLHKNKTDLEQFITEYWDRMPDEVPDEYSRPDGEPKICEISSEIYKTLQSCNGIRNFNQDYPKIIDPTTN